MTETLRGIARARLASARLGRRRGKWTPYLYVLPAVILFAIFVVYPVIYNLLLSFHEWNGVKSLWNPVGVRNYAELVRDRVVGISLRNSGIFVLGHLVVMILALLLALLLNNPYQVRNAVRTIIFLPGVLAPTIIAVTWGTIYEPNFGPLNVTLRKIGLDALALYWLGDPKIAIWALTAIGVWAGLGFPMVVYLASLQTIERDLYDAAAMDGANRRQIFLYIIFPLLRGTHLVLFMLGVIGAVKGFATPWVLTAGGPYYSTSTLTIHVYKNVFNFSRFGYGAALAQFTLVVLVVLILLQRAVTGRGGGA